MSDDSPTVASQKLTTLVMGEGAIATRQVVAVWKRITNSLDCDLFLNLSRFLYD